MNINYEKCVSYKDIKKITPEELTKLKEIAHQERITLGYYGDTYYQVPAAKSFPELVAKAQNRLYEATNYHEGLSITDKAIILANVAFENNNNFIRLLNQKFTKESLIALVDLIEYIKKAKSAGNQSSKIKEYEEKVQRCIIPIKSQITKFNGKISTEIIINKINEIIAFESEKLISKEKKQGTKKTEKSKNKLITDENIDKHFQVINQLIKANKYTKNIELVYTTLYKTAKEPTIDCVCTYTTKGDNIISCERFTKLVSCFEEVAKTAKELGMVFNYSIIPSDEFKRNLTMHDVAGNIIFDQDGNTIYNSQLLAVMASSTMLICNNRRFLKYFKSIDDIKNNSVKTKKKIN